MLKRILLTAWGLVLLAILILVVGQVWFRPAGEELKWLRERVVRFGGSTTVYPIASRAAQEFHQKNPAYTVIVSESSTGEGLEDLLSADLDLVGATRLPTDVERAAAKKKGFDLVPKKIGLDAVALIVHPSKFQWVKNITRAQAKAIFFDGTITDWSEIDSRLSGPINVYVRNPKNSGTAALFAQKVAGSEKTPYISRARNVELTPLIVPTVAADPDGIAYTPLKWVDQGVRALAIAETPGNPVLPTSETITTGRYPLVRDVMVIIPSATKKGAEQFLDFLLEEAGQKIRQEEGFYPAR